MLVDKIKNIVPEAEIDESDILTVTVEPAKYRELALRLKGDQDLSFDFMICMTGMDWGDTLGVISLLQSTAHEHEIIFKDVHCQPGKPGTAHCSDIWPRPT